jgi:hypothetical protein
MPVFTLLLDDDQYRRLSEQYKRMSIEWLGSKQNGPPTFEQWLAAQAGNPAPGTSSKQRDTEEMRLVDTLERLITLLQANGFALAQTDQREPEEAAEALALAFASNLGLSPQRARRVRDLFAYYARSAREVADTAKLVTTKRSYDALHDACRALTERTKNAAKRLGGERALGRVEGALAILVMLQVMSPQNANEKTDAFKRQLME